ncbi:McrB family protein [Acinetobacter lwoffii]|uniref:McrB family protein n=1 Tax=Acinetobacter lwoffii TaxID=28090 RepID=UPI000B03E489|nr:AAA family ATPase [Acinetobacter lwoffii]
MDFWVAGADWDGEDQTAEFIEKGIWQNGYTDKYLDRVNAIQAGDRIAIKAIYGQKYNMPFNNYGCLVSCMKVKAIGTVKKNLNDGRTLEVEWEQQFEPEKIIYFYTYRQTITRIKRKDVQDCIFLGHTQDLTELENLYKKRSESRKEKLTDEFILKQFKNVPNFNHIEQNTEHRKLFLELARYIHETPMDWWVAPSERPPVRFGTNNKFNGRNSTVSYVAAVGFDQNGTFYIPNENESEFSIDELGTIRLTASKLEELKSMSLNKMETDRDPFVGYWPENYNNIEMIETDMNPSEQIKQPLNRILFGAAGTGKTYHTINHALSIIENKPLEVLEQEDRTALKLRFDQYKEQGQIKFVTFHQSFSYEDFVEGIRAETDDNEQLSYDVKAGVFKEICEDAQIETDAKQNNVSAPIEASINSAIDKLITQAKTEEMIFHTKRGAEIKVSSNSAGTLFAFTSTGSNITLSIRHIRNYLKTQSDIIVDQKSYEWAIANSLRSEVEYVNSIEKVKPYVLIIDEINRGNISRIFGELITLIEDSKRQGADEALSVTLPYSKDDFSVPDNVYIIGTMNSSDRSLTGLDIALRRRFTFIEMPPKPELLTGVEVKGLDIRKLLEVINQRIEVLLDRDHCIGHANFMTLQKDPSLTNLAQIFKQKIIPQLQEYFFDDWSKINMVLNANGMLRSNGIDKSVLFPNVAHESESYFEEQKTWEVVDDVFNSIESFTKIIKH